MIGAMFDEILYADDTIIHSTNSKKVTKLLNEIKTKRPKYGLKLNHEKCEAMSVGGISEVYSLNGDRIKEYDESTYLGCFQNNKTHAHREIKRRMGKMCL